MAFSDSYSIIAVHGLGSNVDWAWTHKEGHKHVHWLRDSDMLPARVPSARIMVYSYDSKWHADAPVLRLQECGRGLFDAIHEDRERHPKSAQRAMLFVGHSLGGNVIINVSRPTSSGCLTINAVLMFWQS